MTEHSNWLIFV